VTGIDFILHKALSS